MARTKRPKQINRYALEFKLTAVRLSSTPGVKVNDVAEALAIHPFMLSRWRKEARDGKLRAPKATKRELAVERETGISPSELQRFAELKRKHALLKEEHEILKKAIRFCSDRRAMSSPSSTKSGTGSASGSSAKSSK